MDGQRQIFDRVTVPTRIIVHRSEIGTSALAGIIEKGEFVPAGGEVCELEAGGQIIARGKIVRRRGGYWFKVVATAKEEGR